MRGLKRWAPLGVLLAFTLWVVFPFLSLNGWLFAGQIEGDFLRGAWLYDFTSRQVREGTLPFSFTDFGYPEPISRAVTLPNVIDAALLAPLGWAFGWPKQFGVTMAVVIAVNALGLAWLARSAGCRGWGVAVAGCLGAVMWPVWRELHIGRINDAWLGIPFGALAAFLDLARMGAGGGWGSVQSTAPPTSDHPTTPNATRRLLKPLLVGMGRVGLAATLGALTLSIYPPYAPMVALPGVFFFWPHIRRRPGRVLLLVSLAAGLGVAMAWPEIALMTARAGRHKAPCIADKCPKQLWYVEGIRMLGLKAHEAWLWLPATGAAIGSWALLPLALVARGRRWVALAIVGVLAVYVRLSLGSCPTLHPVDPALEHLVGATGALEDWIWCNLGPIHDTGRFFGVGLGMAAVLSGLGVEALLARGRLLRALGALLGVAAITHSAWVLREGTFPPQFWHEVPTPVTATFLRTAEPGPVAELPWDEAYQYLSVLAAPGSPRVNPVAPVFTPESKDPFIRWLHTLARGETPLRAPSRRAIGAVGVRWVFWDPHRCDARRHWGDAPCRPEIAAALEEILGPPEMLAGDVRVWDLSTLPP